MLDRLGRDNFGIDVPFEVFPADDNRTTPVPGHRVAALRAHLAVEAAAMVAPPPLDDLPPPVADAGRDAAFDALPLASICAKCRGFCCRVGGDTGYVTAATLARTARAAGSSDGLIDRYVALVPHRTYAYSCIFHGPAGCALPRDLRSDTCNDFLCPSLVKIATAAIAEPDRPYLAAFRQPVAGYRVYAVENLVPRRLPMADPRDE